MTPRNVTKDAMRRYLDVFHETYNKGVEEYLSSHKNRLLRHNYLKHGRVGYVSTQFGAGYEYRSDTSGTDVKLSSKRIELLYTGAPGRLWHSRVKGLLVEPGTHTAVRIAIRNGFPFVLNSVDSGIILIDSEFETDEWKRKIEYAEIYGNRTASRWSLVSAVGCAKDELLVALNDLRQAGVRSITIDEYIGWFKEKSVLVLGDYDLDGKQRLDSIAGALRELGYSPVLASEIPENPDLDLLQKITVIGGVSRFVVIDDSSRSGHLTEFPQILQNRWFGIVLRMTGSHSSYMTRGLAMSTTMITERSYTKENLPTVLADAVAWVEPRITERRSGLAAELPWRLKPS